jgi:hypothetical protein
VRLGEALEANGAQLDKIKAPCEKGLELIDEGRMRNGKKYPAYRIWSALTFALFIELNKLTTPVALKM